jgi:CMP/dCMP kinase
MKKGFSIAIDGPVASGKGTVAKALANKLKGSTIDTGAMYRCVALMCINNNLDINKEEDVVKVLPKINVEFRSGKVFLNGEDVTERIRKEDAAHGSSVVAVYPKVRIDLVKKQQIIAGELISKGGIVIMEGRDIGTRVLPKADLKVFLTADVWVRAERSMLRYKHKGFIKTLDEVLEETKIRDYRDSHRDMDPLAIENPQKFGYWVLDDSKQTENETINAVLNELKSKGLTE